MWFTIPIKERRQRPLAERLFERRTGGGDDARVIRYLSGLGEDKVRSLLSQGSLISRRTLVRRWLKSLQPEDSRSRLRALTVLTSMTAAVAIAAFFTLNGPAATDAGETATAEDAQVVQTAQAESEGPPAAPPSTVADADVEAEPPVTAAPAVKVVSTAPPAAPPAAPPIDEMEVAALASIAPAAGPASMAKPEPEPEPATKPEPEPATKPEPEPEIETKPSAASIPPPGSLYYVIGSFRRESNARRYSVMQSALKPRVVIGTANNGLRHYRVLVGPVTVERRLSLRRRIAAAGIANAWSLRH